MPRPTVLALLHQLARVAEEQGHQAHSLATLVHLHTANYIADPAGGIGELVDELEAYPDALPPDLREALVRVG